MRTSPLKRVLAIARKQKIIRPRDVEALGIPREYLLRLMRQGVIQRPGRGLYEMSDAKPTEHHTLAVVATLAEQKCGKELSRKIAFRWVGQSHSIVSEKIADHIVERVFVDEEHIYPCVDIGVGDVLDDGTLLIVANVAGYEPRPFGRNWTGRDGPFVRIVGGPFLNKMAGKKDSWSPDKAFAFITPDSVKAD